MSAALAGAVAKVPELGWKTIPFEADGTFKPTLPRIGSPARRFPPPPNTLPGPYPWIWE